MGRPLSIALLALLVLALLPAANAQYTAPARATFQDHPGESIRNAGAFIVTRDQDEPVF